MGTWSIQPILIERIGSTGRSRDAQLANTAPRGFRRGPGALDRSGFRASRQRLARYRER